MTTYIKSQIWMTVIMMVSASSQAQSKQQQGVKQTEKLFSGIWVDKQTTRHLEISFKNGYATITDWTSNFQKRESGDIYKATLKKGKLIMPEDTQHRAPYSEIIYKNNTLIYLTKPLAPRKTVKWDKEIFTRSH